MHPLLSLANTASEISITESNDEDEIMEYQFEMSILSKVVSSFSCSLSFEKRRHFVSLLLEFGADPNLDTSGIDSCLMHAVRYGDPVLVKTLLEANAETGHIGNNGCTVLHVFFLTYHSSGTVLFLILYRVISFSVNIISTIHLQIGTINSTKHFQYVNTFN